MAKHNLKYFFEVEFEDGTKKEIPLPDRLYYFNQQRSSYLISSLETLIEKEKITSKPLFITEKYKVIECEEYQIIIGL